ncbi:MAG: TonB-dependent receptor [Lewinellaceae bacterium]|nr:TonB-dependent receptor [Lewinellaceae bacterium]
MKKVFTALLLCAVTVFAYAQTGAVSGMLTDGDTGEPIFGATIAIKGLAKGAITDFDGSFTITDVLAGPQTVIFSYTGYESQEIPVEVVSGETTSIGKVVCRSSAIGLTEVKVIASVAVSRQTPVAVSTVGAKQIEAKIGSQEFPEILKSTPGVYATKEGGGFGDGRINVRGFSSENVAVLINGVPVNDMENGIVYWSNWAGLTDATSFMQVQRGLGASKVAVPSIGGTINIISKATDLSKGGHVYAATGNNAYSKVGFGLSSGLTEDGWAFTISGAKTQGNGYVDGTNFLSFSYYANIAKKINADHEVTFTAIGAKQRHGQREDQSLLVDYENSPRGIRYNPDWGYKKGQLVNIEDNFYHKPQISLNHYWSISPRSQLSTSVYASFGSGGGGGTSGTNKFNDPNYRVDGVVDLDRIVEENQAVAAFGAESILRASRNDHKWYGILSSYTQELPGNLSLLAGLDLRYYKGEHFREVTDLLGAQYWLDDSDINNPVNAATVGTRFDYYDDGIVNWTGGFLQLEYNEDRLAAFVTLNASNTGYDRVDYFNNYDNDADNAREGLANQRVGTFNFFGYGAKGGANYNLSESQNVFANIGYFEKAPGFDAVFPNFVNEDPNVDAVNQKIISYELGYGLRMRNFSVNLNLYRTQWKDRTYTDFFNGPNGEELVANILGVNALHQGVEIDGVWRVNRKLNITGMASIGDWTWQNDIENLGIFEGNTQVGEVDAYIAGLHVGDAAQTTVALGLAYKLMPDLRVSIDYNYYDRLYANYDPTSRSDESARGVEAWKIPAFGIFDLNITYDFQLSGFNASLYGNVYNLMNEKYVMDAQDGTNHDAFTSRVYYGYGANWHLGVKIRF